MAATGMPDGEYLLAGIPVEVANSRASLKGDSTVLAGSVLTLDKALTNFIAYTGATVENALPLLTQNPAAMTGLGDSAGAIRVGAPANLLALDNAGSLLASIVNGQLQPPI
jgi:N-acetylglucosamine-6-phosphate deacetylase